MPEEAQNEAEDDVYVGETSCSMVTRMEVHLTDYVGAMPKSTVVKSAREHKGSEEPTATMPEE